MKILTYYYSPGTSRLEAFYGYASRNRITYGQSKNLEDDRIDGDDEQNKY